MSNSAKRPTKRQTMKYPLGLAIRQLGPHLSEVNFGGVVGQKPDDTGWRAGASEIKMNLRF